MDTQPEVDTAPLEANKAVVLDWLDAIFNGPEQRLLDLMAEDCTFFVLGETEASGFRTREGWLEGWRQATTSLPGDVTMHIGQVTAEGDRVAVEAESHGTSCTGEAYNNQYHFLFRVRDGKVTAFKEYFDTQHAFRVFDMPLGVARADRPSNLEGIAHTIVRRR